MGRNRVYGSLEKARAEKNRRRSEQYAAAWHGTKNEAPLGVCTLAVTAFNIREPNTMNQPNMGATESSLGSDSLLHLQRVMQSSFQLKMNKMYLGLLLMVLTRF